MALRWHTLDHRPEQHRLSAVRASLRLVSTPACREARALGDGQFDAVDHMMTYFFSDVDGLQAFNELSGALGGADRKVALLPPVQRGVYDVQTRVAVPRIKIGSDVLPWWPARGVYLLLEQGDAPPAELLGVEGVAGVWSASAREVDRSLATAQAGQRITYCFLDDEPAATAERLRPALEKRWARADVEPLFAAPFHLVVPHEWNRYVP
jgi:hypothetical protein